MALRKGLSGATLQTIAADLSVICGAAATLTNAAIALDRLPEPRGRPVVQALSAANAKWRDAARWPQSIYLGGVRDASLTDASIHLRQMVVDTLRKGAAWAEPRIIDGRVAGHDLLAIARRATHVAAEAGKLHQAAITNLFWGRDRVLMAARSLEGSAFMNKAVFEARRRGTWIPMPRYEQTGLEVYRAATNAANATFNAHQLGRRRSQPASRDQGVGVICGSGVYAETHRSPRNRNPERFGRVHGQGAPVWHRTRWPSTLVDRPLHPAVEPAMGHRATSSRSRIRRLAIVGPSRRPFSQHWREVRL